MPAVSALYRHPVKSLGAEALSSIQLIAGRTVPGDRVWALLHEKSRYDRDDPAWAHCSTFLRAATFPSLIAVTAEGEANGAGGAVTFRHPDRPDITVDPATADGEAALISWADPLIPAGMPRPKALAAAPGRGMTDTQQPTVSILSDASLTQLSAAVGLPLDRRRFRGNVWLSGLEPWAEFDLVGRTVRIGGATLEVRQRTGRCSATHANPETGERDANMLGVLADRWGHEDFGVYAIVKEGGDVGLGDEMETLP